MKDLHPTLPDEDDGDAADAAEASAFAGGRSGAVSGDQSAHHSGASSPTTNPSAEVSPPVPGSGTEIGRFMVLGLLGIGGMGVVLSAYDPHLDRKVALKLLRGDQWRGRADLGREALLREAQAMARLSHPNVLAVYEAGVLEGTGYVVMEQIEGRTLRRWLDEPRGWQEVLEVLCAAGAGLAAAHRAGIVHRDFKPENVLVGEDGRVLVSDFGLAGDASSSRGTPAYMAPEQLTPPGDRASTSSPASDLFSFCVTVWEALHGERPRRGEPAASAAAPSTAPSVPAARKAPSWVYAALLRGLAPDPAARWPSMEALLAELSRRRRVGGVLAAAGVGVVVLAAAAFFVGREAVRGPSCDGAPRLAGIWDAARAAEVARAFAEPSLRYGAAAWPRVSEQLDAYARGWTAMYAEACRATRVEGRQSDTLLDLRMECLERRRGVLGNLTALWSRGMSAELVEAALESALRLPPLAGCADARALTGRIAPPEDAASRAAIATVRAQLDRATALLLASQREPARVTAATARVLAEATGWPQVRAEAALVEGHALVDLEDATAEPRLLLAARLGGASRDDALAATALVDLVQHLAEDQQRAERALLVADVADGVVLRAGDAAEQRVSLLRFRGAALRVKSAFAEAQATLEEARRLAAAAFGEASWSTTQLDAELSRVAEARGDYAEARRLGERVLEAAIVRFGTEHPRVAAYLNNLAMAVDSAGDAAAARDYYYRALAIKEKVIGEDAASTALTLNNLGMVELSLGNLDKAGEQLERALLVRERVLGPRHPFVATTLGNLSSVYRRRGHLARAREVAQRALEIKLAAYGPVHANVANSLSDLARLTGLDGKPAEALELDRRALAVREQALGKDHPRTRRSRNQVAGRLLQLGRCAEALPILEGNLAASDAAAASGGKPDGEVLGVALMLRSECALTSGAVARARADGERAVATLVAAKAEPSVLGAAELRRGRALWAAGQREAAQAAMRAAEQGLATDEPDPAVGRDLAEVRGWLAAHGR